MGIKSQGKILWKASSIHPIHLKDVVNNSLSQRESHKDGSDHIQADVDISNVAHCIWGSNNNINSEEVIKKVAIFLKQLANQTGFLVTAVLDGDNRP